MKFSMNWMFKSVAFSLLLSLIIGNFISVNGQSSTPVFNGIKQLFEENRVFTADFVHEYRDSFTGETQATQGEIWIGQNRYKIEGGEQRVVVDGEFSTVYDGTKNRVIISDYVEEEDDFAPSRMLQGVDDDFLISEEKKDNGETKISLKSDDPFSIFFEVFIYVDADGIPIRIEAFDQAENELLTRFENGQFVNVTEGLFDLNVPENAELIDLRQDLR